jgi:hypothetical protein
MRSLRAGQVGISTLLFGGYAALYFCRADPAPAAVLRPCRHGGGERIGGARRRMAVFPWRNRKRKVARTEGKSQLSGRRAISN